MPRYLVERIVAHPLGSRMSDLKGRRHTNPLSVGCLTIPAALGWAQVAGIILGQLLKKKLNGWIYKERRKGNLERGAELGPWQGLTHTVQHNLAGGHVVRLLEQWRINLSVRWMGFGFKGEKTKLCPLVTRVSRKQERTQPGLFFRTCLGWLRWTGKLRAQCGICCHG